MNQNERLTNEETLIILEIEFGLTDIRTICTTDAIASFWLDWLVIDCYMFGKSVTDYSDDAKFIKFIYKSNHWDARYEPNCRNMNLIKFLRENRDMIDLWRL